MTDQTENQGAPPEEEKPGSKRLLKVKSGRLDLKRTVSAGQVRQNFSHGRSKSVAVEVRRKRSFSSSTGDAVTAFDKLAPAAAETPEKIDRAALEDTAEDGPSRRPAVLRTLTEEEAVVRARALKGARESEGTSAQFIDQVSRDSEARRSATRVEQEEREHEEAQRREDEERRRSEEEERKRSEEETARKALEQSERLEARAGAADPARPGRRPAAVESEEDESKRPRRPGRAEVRRPSPRRTTEPRRRAGKLTIAQALNDEERVRSLLRSGAPANARDGPRASRWRRSRSSARWSSRNRSPCRSFPTAWPNAASR